MQDLRDHKDPQALLDLKARLEIPALRETLDLPAHKATQVQPVLLEQREQRVQQARLERLELPDLLEHKASKAFKV
jgi:hypothetical protein